MARPSKYNGKDGLLLPISSDDVFLMNILDSSVMISTTNISKQDAFPTDYKSNLQSVLKIRNNAIALKPLALSSMKPSSRFESLELSAFDENLFQKMNNVEKTINLLNQKW